MVDQALDKAIAAVRPGMRYRDVGDIISTHVSSNGFQVVKAYCGHGIGDLFHCAPNIPHYGRNKVHSIVLLFPVLASHHVPSSCCICGALCCLQSHLSRVHAGFCAALH